MELADIFCNFANVKSNAIISKMEGSFAIRLKLFVDSLGIQTSQFADSCEIPRPTFSQLLSGRNQKVSDILIGKIHSAYPELSIMWLMFGEGSMIIKDASDCQEDDSMSKIVCEKEELREMGQDSLEYSNLRGFNNIDKSLQDTVYQQLEDNKKILALQMQIENIQKNARRVAQITVYYDDSTFETFIPSKQ